MSDLPLFGGFEPTDPTPAEDLSAGQRLTRRQAADIALGRHPLTGGQLHPDADRDNASGSREPFTCGTCTHRRPGGFRAYPKCTNFDGRLITHGPASDVRAWWPACTYYEPKDTE